MNRRTLIATVVAVLAMPTAALLAAPATALAAKSPPVTVRVEGLTHNLLVPTVVRVPAGSITRYGAPKGACNAKSAQGALNVATHRRWFGSWNSQYDEYEITSILGEKHSFTSSYFWEIFVNGTSATAGACELHLHRGEHLVFAAVPDSGSAYVTAIRAPHKVTHGQPFSVEIVAFNAQGQAQPLPGATVSGGGMSATTDSNGMATLTAPASGPLVLHEHHPWSASAAYVRAAPVRVQVT